MQKALPVVVALVSAFLAGCDIAKEDDHTYRATSWYFLATGDTDTTVSMQIMRDDDLDAIESQTGITQNVGNGLIWGSVRQAGSLLSSIQVTALNDAGSPVGTLVYQDTDGTFDTGLSATTPAGGFALFNVPAGRINIRCTSGASGNLYVDSVADETVLAVVEATVPFGTIAWSGATRSLVGLPTGSLPEPSVNVFGHATGGPFPVVSDSSGVFSATVPQNNAFLLRLAKSGFVDTYNYTPGFGDLLVVSTATLSSASFTPASVTLDLSNGIVWGQLAATSGSLDGYSVQCLDLNGSSTGTLRYGDAAGIPSDALTATSSSGVFVFYNVPPGRVFVRATKAGFGGSYYAEAFGGGVTALNGRLVTAANSSGNDSITVSGQLLSLALAGVPKGNIQFLGWPGVAGSDDEDDDFAYSIGGVPSHHRFIVRTWK